MASTAWRWTKRIVLGAITVVVVAVALVLVLLHTDWGRNIARAQVEARLNQAFVGGAQVGALEGSVLGTMVLRDVVINGPDEQPAITIEKLSLGLGILPLFTKQARVVGVRVEGLEIDLRRAPTGELQTAHMVRPNEEKSGWAVQIPSVVVRDAHIRVHGAHGDTNLDHVDISGGVSMPTDGPVRANVLMMARWRERDVPVWLDTVLHDDRETLTIGSLLARIGDAQVTAAGLRVIKPKQPTLVAPRATPTVVSGLVAVDASRQAIAKLVPDVDVPIEDVMLSVVIAPRPLGPWTHLAVRGTVDRESLFGEVDVDPAARRARGVVTTGRVDLTRLTRGSLAGTGVALAAFDGVLPRGAGVLPVGGAMVHVGGDLSDLSDAVATIAVTSTGERAAAAITAATAGATVQLGGEVTKHGERLALASGRVVARSRDPERATGGRAPVRGTLGIDVVASGVLAPEPDLAVRGHVVGARLRTRGASIRSLRLAIAAAHLPRRPIGKAELRARDVVRGNVVLRELAVNAANREDGKIAVTVRTRPLTDPWLVEADALVTPGARGAPTHIDLIRHRVRVANGTEWTGAAGTVVIGKRQIVVREISTRSTDGAVAISGELQRATGDLTARVEVAAFALACISRAYAGTLGARIDLARTAGRFTGVVDADLRGVVVSPRAPPLDGHAHVEAGAQTLVVAATGGAPQLGAFDLALEVATPGDLTSATAWRRLGRRDLRSGRLRLTGLDAGRVARLASLAGEYSGRIAGEVRISAAAIGGDVRVEKLSGPALNDLGPISAHLTLAQTAPDELQPSLVATIDNRDAHDETPLARLAMQATLGVPDRPLDLAAWQQLGAGAFKGGVLRVDDVTLDPALLERLQITTNLRGRASLTAAATANLTGVTARLAVRDLRGTPIELPVAVDVTAAIDGGATTATVEVTSTQPFPQRLLDATARVPVSLAALLARPRELRDAKLAATVTMPQVPASRIASTVGRAEVTGGVVTGTVDVRGTLASPVVKARVTGTNIAVPPGPGGRPVKAVKLVTVAADWDGTAGKLGIDAWQDDGMLALAVHGRPRDLGAARLALVASRFDLQPLLAFAPGPPGGAGGRLDGKLAVAGFDPRRMTVAGELHLTEGRLPIDPAIGTMRRAKIDVVIGDQLIVDVDGRLGGGTLQAHAKLGLEGALPTGGEATIALRKTSPIGTVEPEISADVTAKLTRRPDAWVADFRFAHGWVKVPGGRGEKLDPIGKPDDMRFVTERTPRAAKAVGEEHRPERPSFIANIVIEPTFVDSTELRGYLRGRLTIERAADAVGIVGQVETVRGDLDLFGRRYQLDRGIVRFDGSTDPLLDVVVTHDFPEVTTRTAVRGRLSDPELMLSAEPNTYSQGQLLGFLLGGEPSGRPTDSNPRDEALSAGASIVANKIGNYVKQALPLDIDVLRYESATSTSGAAITVGTWLSRSLFVAYRRRIAARADENSGEGEIEYWLTRRVMIEGVVGDRGYNGVDLLWRKRY